MRSITQVADFWDREPCGSGATTHAQHTAEYWKETEERRYSNETHVKPFANFAHWKGKKVLEIGTGIGVDGASFACAGAHYCGVDLSAQSLALAQERFAAEGLTGTFYHGSAEELSSFVPVEPYDLIYSFGVIHHTPHPERVLAELKKYCGPHTELRIMLYATWSWKVLRIVIKEGHGAWWRRRALVERYSEAQLDCPVIYTYTFRQVRELMKDFEIIEMKKSYLSVWGWEERLVALLPTTLRRALERLLGWNILIVARRTDL